MNPLVTSAVSARLGPWLGRLATNSAPLFRKLVEQLAVGGKFAGSKVQEVVAWAKANPGNMALLLSTLAAMGVSVVELFDKTTNRDVVEFKNSLEAVAERASAMIDAAGAKSEALSAPEVVKEVVTIQAQKVTLAWAKQMFGGELGAVNAHRFLQAFLEMPLSNVQFGFENYKIPVFDPRDAT